MTQQQDDPPTAEGPAADKISSSVDDGSRGEPRSEATQDPNSFTLAGPGSDPAAPAVQPVTAPATPPATAPSGDYDKYGVPTLDFVRNKIEARYAASLGAEELARETAAAKSFEQREEERAKAAEVALEKIRRSLRDHRQS